MSVWIMISLVILAVAVMMGLYVSFSSGVRSSHAVGLASIPYPYSLASDGSLSSNEYSQRKLKAKLGDGGVKIRVLLLTAHPDDESMFFGPSILGLAQKYEQGGVEVEWYLHCLSKGLNCGEERRNELMQAGPLLGFGKDAYEAEKRILVDDLQDGDEWKASEVVERLKGSVKRWGIDVVVTFDENGISGHKNHKSCFHGAKSLWTEQGGHSLKGIYILQSPSIVQKYLGDAFFVHQLSALAAHPQFNSNASPLLLANPSPHLLHIAMQAHRSQYVWFRRLYILASQLVYFNVLLPISSTE